MSKSKIDAVAILYHQGCTAPLWAAEDPHGLEPAENMVFIPKLAGLKNETYRNQSGEKKYLSETEGHAEPPPDADKI
jgi:hypothetical protein